MSFDLGTVIRSSIVLLSAVIINEALRRASASTRHTIWTIALVAALAVPFLTNVFPNLSLPLLSTPTEATTLMPIGQSSEMLSQRPDRVTVQLSTNSKQSEIPPSNEGTAKSLWLRLWAAGAVLIGLRWLIGVYGVHQLGSKSSPVQNVHWDDLLAAEKRVLSIRARIRLRICGDAISPMTWGLFRHTILLPGAALSWNTERLRFVLAHELAHVKRNEGWTQLLIQTATIVYWFNPLAWYAAYRMRSERERACDNLVLNLGANAEDYAEHLLEIARGVTSGWTIAAVSMVHPSQLEARLRAILDPGNSRRRMSRLQTGIVLACAALLTVSIASTQFVALPLAPRLLTAMPAAPEPLHSTPPVAVAASPAVPRPQSPSSFAMVIVLDKSGSMGGQKMDLAKEATQSALNLMRDDQWFGIVTFNDQSDWAVPLRPAKDRTMMERQINQIAAVGETDIYPALRDAYVGLAKVEAAKKHVVLLTDGRSLPGTYPPLLDDMNKANITLSTIAVGQGADRDLLTELANSGHGRTYFVLPEETSRLPEIFRVETRITQEQRAAASLSPPAGPTFISFTICKESSTWVRPSAEQQAKIWNDPRYAGQNAQNSYEWTHEFLLVPPDSTSIQYHTENEAGLWTEGTFSPTCDAPQYKDNAQWIEAWILLHRVRTIQLTGAFYTVTVEPVSKGFESIIFEAPGKDLAVRFVDTKGRLLEEHKN